MAMLATAELTLRSVMSPIDAVPPRISQDSLGLPSVTVRQMEEGVATTHFSWAGARLTGAAPLAGAPTVVIIGDSYVVAREVPDERTMGAWLERTGRDSGRPVNVRQYGWRGAAPARYLVSAAAVRARWNPRAIIVPLSDDDLDERATSGNMPYLHVDSTGLASVIGEAPAEAAPVAVSSVLVTLVERRWHQILARSSRRVRQLVVPRTASAAAPVSRPSAAIDARPSDLRQVPAAVVHELKNAYGDRLVIAYLADVRVVGGDTAVEGERRLLEACRTELVRCVSTRATMLSARRGGIIGRGFPTTTLGVGHLNGDGHRLLAFDLWPLVQPLLSPGEAR
jgi:hypothetical protein